MRIQILFIGVILFIGCGNKKNESPDSKLLQQVATIFDNSYNGKILDLAYNKNFNKDLASIEFLTKDVGLSLLDLEKMDIDLNWADYNFNNLEVLDSVGIDRYLEEENRKQSRVYSNPIIETSQPYFNINGTGFFIVVVVQNGFYAHTNYLYYEKKDQNWEVIHSKTF